MSVVRKSDIFPKISWFERNYRHQEQYQVNQNQHQNIYSHNSNSTRRQPISSQSGNSKSGDSKFGSNGVKNYELPLEASLRRHRQTPKNFSYIPEHRRKILESPRSKFTRTNRLEFRETPKSNSIPVVPNSESLPLWLLRWQTFQRYSSITAFLLVMASLTVYGWTVYAQQLWSQNSRKLQELQRQERQITTANETIKNKMAKEAEKPTAGLVAPTPAQTIFVSPTSGVRKSISGEIVPNFEIPQQNNTPIGY